MSVCEEGSHQGDYKHGRWCMVHSLVISVVWSVWSVSCCRTVSLTATLGRIHIYIETIPDLLTKDVWIWLIMGVKNIYRISVSNLFGVFNLGSDRSCIIGFHEWGHMLISWSCNALFIGILLNILQLEGYGCWIVNHYYGSTGYTDDLKLLSPRIYGLRKITIICEEFGKEYCIQYQPATPTVCVQNKLK